MLPDGVMSYELTDDQGAPIATIDLAWPNGLQEGLSPPVAVLIDEDELVEKACNTAGFRFFTNIEAFKHYVERDVLALTA